MCIRNPETDASSAVQPNFCLFHGLDRLVTEGVVECRFEQGWKKLDAQMGRSETGWIWRNWSASSEAVGVWLLE